MEFSDGECLTTLEVVWFTRPQNSGMHIQICRNIFSDRSEFQFVMDTQRCLPLNTIYDDGTAPMTYLSTDDALYHVVSKSEHWTS